MNPLQHTPLLLILLALTVSPVCADELFSLKAGYHQLTPDGEFAVSAGGFSGTPIDMDEDLNFDDSEDFYAEAALQLGAFRLFAAYLPLEFTGSGTLSEDIVFNGETFTIGTRVDSAVELDVFEAGLAWYLINIDDLPTRIQLGPELAVKYVDATLAVDENLTGRSESESVAVPIPTIGLRARIALGDYFGLSARAGYLEYDKNSFLDADVQVEFSPLPLVGVFAGYRYVDIDVDEEDVLIDATLDGPFVGALIRF